MRGVVGFGEEAPAEKPGLEGGKVVGAYGTGHGRAAVCHSTGGPAHGRGLRRSCR